ncbi:MAG TPA: ABC transporter ATP-binding protein, partial [Bacillota bacterium]|nr:ABC transporter ATP-binding protein [Bacillota bacterium]
MKHNSLSLQLSNIFFKQNKLNWGISLITEILLGLLGILLSWLIQQMVDSAVGTAGAIPMMTLVWLNLVVMALVIGVLGMRRHFLPNFLRKAMLQYKNKVYEKLTQKNLASFTKEETSTYLSALSNDIAAIELNYLGNSFSLVSHILVFFATFALMLYYSPLMTLAAIVLMILPVAASLATGRKVAVHEKRLSDKNESFISQLKDSLTGFSVIKAFQAEKELFRQFENSNQTVENAKRDKRRAEALVLQISATAGITAQLGIFLIGAFLIISRHAVTVGMLMAFVNLMGVLTRPIQELPGLIAKRKAAFTLIRKMGGILSENVDDEGIAVDQHLKSGITIRDLSFGY